jgi:hypothetical protein
MYLSIMYLTRSDRARNIVLVSYLTLSLFTIRIPTFKVALTVTPFLQAFDKAHRVFEKEEAAWFESVLRTKETPSWSLEISHCTQHAHASESYPRRPETEKPDRKGIGEIQNKTRLKHVQGKSSNCKSEDCFKRF